MSFRRRDTALAATKALPAEDAAIVTGAMDTGVRSDNADLLAEMELEIVAPALAVAELGNAATMTYDVIGAATSALYASAPTELGKGVLVQTGASGAGAAAATKRFRLPTDCPRYVGVRATNSADADASAKSVIARLLF